ncbi:MAG: LuxR family transcriptional regulator, partial [Pseudomonas alloputida]
HGVALPLHGGMGHSGMLSLVWQGGCAKAYQRHLDDTLGRATLLRDFALESAISLLSRSQWSHDPLTKRELEVLLWSAAGKTTWEISMILSCSSSTIEFHFKNIRRKFNVSSRQLAVVKALQTKLINPEAQIRLCHLSYLRGDTIVFVTINFNAIFDAMECGNAHLDKATQ